MALKRKTSISDIQKEFARRNGIIQRVCENRMAELGEQAVNEARTNYGYNDQTGNLTASKGYMLATDRGVIGENFQTTFSTASEGERTGKNLARAGVAGFSGGILLKVVAGMSYASAVQSRGKNVLASAELLAEAKMPGILRKIKADIKAIK